MSTCKLCKKDKQLIEAHIIPKWAFKYVRKTDNTLLSISEDSKDRIVFWYISKVYHI